MKITHIVSCVPCSGTGSIRVRIAGSVISPTPSRLCAACSGRGWVRERDLHDSITRAVDDLLSRPHATGIERGLRR